MQPASRATSAPRSAPAKPTAHAPERQNSPERRRIARPKRSMPEEHAFSFRSKKKGYVPPSTKVDRRRFPIRAAADCAAKTEGHAPVWRLTGTGIRTSSKEAVHLHEVELAILQVVLRNTVIDTSARAKLQELDGEILPDETEPILFVFIDVIVRVEVLGGELQVVAVLEHPVRFDESCPQFPARRTAVIRDVVRFGEPRDGSGFEPGEEPLHVSLPRVGVVVVDARPQAPERANVLGPQARLFTTVGLGAAGRPVRNRQLRRPRIRFETDFDAFVGRRKADSRRLAYECAVILEPPSVRQEHLTRLYVPSLIGRREPHIRLEIHAPSRRDPFIDIDEQAVGHDRCGTVDARFLDIELRLRCFVRHVEILTVRSQVTAYGEMPIDC